MLLDKPKFSERPNKATDARAFIDEFYTDEKQGGLLTLAIVRENDPSLYQGLKYFCKRNKCSMLDIMPAGIQKRGRPRTDYEALAQSLNLDPTDKRDALALQMIERKKRDRDKTARCRANKAKKLLYPSM